MQITERPHLVGRGAHGLGLPHRSDCHVCLRAGGTEKALIDADAGADRSRLASLDGPGGDGGHLETLRRLDRGANTAMQP